MLKSTLSRNIKTKGRNCIDYSKRQCLTSIIEAKNGIFVQIIAHGDMMPWVCDDFLAFNCFIHLIIGD